ncbi:MAG: protein kinase [bacterium]
MIGKTVSHYRILDKLGEGGMGVVYKAEDTRLKRTIALKFLPSNLTQDDDTKKRFITEARAASALEHPTICNIHAIDETEKGETFICMAYYEGETLKDKIKRGPLPIAEAVDIAIQIARGLAAAHEAGIIHRDIKPANIILTKRGEVKIVDFGLAKLADQQLTQTDAVMGTVSYLCFDQAQGKKANYQADIWALGVILYEMLTGELPFKGKHDQVVLFSILNEEPPSLTSIRSEVPEELVRIVNHCLSKEPTRRYQSTDALFVDLTNLTGLPDNRIRTKLLQKRNTLLMKNKWIFVAFLAVFAVLATWYVFKSKSESSVISTPIKDKSLAVMYFDNHTEQDDLDDMLVSMLTTNLSRYEELEVVSSQRLFDILKSMGKQNLPHIDRSVASEIADRARVKTMLLGSINKIGEKFRIATQLCDVTTGNIVGSDNVDGNKVEDIFAMVDLLTQNVGQSLELIPPDVKRQPFKISDITTNSYEAYSFYQKGIRKLWDLNFNGAVNYFERALQTDSTFAMAHLYYAYERGWRGLTHPSWDLSPFRRSLELAEKYSRKTSAQERLYILAIQAAINRDFQKAESLFVECVNRYPKERNAAIELANIARINGNLDRAIWASERVLELNPAFGTAYNILANIYAAQKDYAKAISASKKYRALQPDDYHPYYTASEIHVQAGQLDEALRIGEQALQKNPKWNALYPQVGHTYLFQGDGKKARDYFRRSQWNRVGEARLMGWADVYEGQYNEAARQFRKAADLSFKLDSYPWNGVYALVELGKLRAAQGKHDEAMAAFYEAAEVAKPMQDVHNFQVWLQYLSGSALVKKGAILEAQVRALHIQEMVEKERYDRFYLNYYNLLLAEIYISKSEGKTALSALDNYKLAAHYSPRVRTLRAAAHALIGNYEEAIKQYQEFYHFVPARINAWGGNRFDFYYERSRVNYHLAKINQQIGDNSQALEYYRKALKLWKNADEDLPELIETKKRIAALR